jgi:hypothetical protein
MFDYPWLAGCDAYAFKVFNGTYGVFRVTETNRSRATNFTIEYKLLHSGAPAPNTNDLSNMGNPPAANSTSPSPPTK